MGLDTLRKIFGLIAIIATAPYLIADESQPPEAALLAIGEVPGNPAIASDIEAEILAGLSLWFSVSVEGDPGVLTPARRALIAEDPSSAPTVLGTDLYERLRAFPLVVVPFISAIDMAKDGSRADVTVTVAFIQNGNIPDRSLTTLRATEAGDTGSMKGAIGQIGRRFLTELTPFIPEGSVTVLVQIRPSMVIINAGSDDDVFIGTEYEIITPDKDGPQRDTGLVAVTQVDAGTSMATVIFSEPGSVAGAKLIEVDRVGMETSVSVKGLLNRTPTDPIKKKIGLDDAFRQSGAILSVRQTLTRRLHSYKPFAGLDIPIGFNGEIRGVSDGAGLLINTYIGGEVSWYLRRYQITPIVAAGIGFHFPVVGGGSFAVSHAGGVAGVVGQYRFSTDMKITAEAGLSGWFGIQSEFADYRGVYAGFGITYKY